MEAMDISEKLKQAGAAEPQAQAITSAIQEGIHEAEEYANDAVEDGKKDLATKADIAALREDNAKLRQYLAELKSDLSLLILKAVVGSLLAATAMFGVIVTIVLQIITKS